MSTLFAAAQVLMWVVGIEAICGGVQSWSILRRPDCARDARDEGAHRVTGQSDAGGVDLRARLQVAHGLERVDLHEAGEALTPVGARQRCGWVDPLIVGPRAALLVD